MESKTFLPYIGTKQVKAMPMGAGEAKNHGANITEEVVVNNIGKDGYLVEYEDGYRSWSPAIVFEASYDCVANKADILAHQLKVQGKRIIELTEALCSTSPIMPDDEREMIECQLILESNVFNVLLARHEAATRELIASSLCGDTFEEESSETPNE